MRQMKQISLFGLAAGAMAVATPAAAAPVGSAAFADLIEDRMPAVVFVEVSVAAGEVDLPFRDDPRFEEFLERFGDRFDMPEEDALRMGVGSGFLISQDGYIVTNHHVIEDAVAVTVTLEDGTEHEATVVGSDPLTDIALLDIEGTGFPVVDFGASEAMRVGEGVFAIGSPFGLGGTVTTGIVSAKSRDIRSGPFDDFIQTDAAVNRGNSGGPLFNLAGEVIGVNTAIFSPGGGSVGIGFAVPSDLVTEIVADLRDDGKIARSWLGVQLKPVTGDVAHVLGMEDGSGAMVAAVLPDTPAQAAGLEEGDIVLNFAGQEIADVQDLMRAVALSPADEVTPLTIFRQGAEIALDVTLADRAEQDA